MKIEWGDLMNKKGKWVGVLCGIFICIIGMITPVTATTSQAHEKIELSSEEQNLVSRTQQGEPISMGIIPHAFPLSECPPSSSDYVGMNVEMLDLITEISGLRFEYSRIPLERVTPYQLLQENAVSLVAGTIKLDGFLGDPKLILSDRLCDGSAACIAKMSMNPSETSTGKVAIMDGYQAGYEFAKELVPSYEIVPCSDNREVVRAVREGAADLAMISRYVGIYELQNPMNDELVELPLFRMEKDSCVMGINTPENQVAISIINKALAAIGEEGYNYVQMDFSLKNPYKLTVIEQLYKYRYILLVGCVALIGFSLLIMRLIYAQRDHKRLSLDPLTGAFTEAGFALAAVKVLAKEPLPLFITDFDIYHFSSYNEVNGKEQGDKLLKNIVKIVKSQIGAQDIICRTYADHFKVLSSKNTLEELVADIRMAVEHASDEAKGSIMLNFGIYQVTDPTVPIDKMLDFAAMAKKHVKNDANTFVGVFDEALLNHYVSEAKMNAAFPNAIKNGEFVVYYQPKFDTIQKTVNGAEALVRWISSDGTLIPPGQFIELFEKSGRIQQLDFYVLERICLFLRGLREKGMPMIPIAVNFSRVHLYSDEFVKEVSQIVEGYGIPKNLIEIECTETTMLDNIELTRDILGSLQAQGFLIAMDDFGSAYSSLNTLCSIPLDVLKLDRGFLMATLSHEKKKANIIIRSVMTLAHDLLLMVVAEGVETEEQYQFLKSLGCDIIQGYYFSRPLKEEDFLDLLRK